MLSLRCHTCHPTNCTRTAIATPALQLSPHHKQVRELEGAVATASTDAAAGRVEAKQARAALAALEWRVDKVRWVNRRGLTRAGGE